MSEGVSTAGLALPGVATSTGNTSRGRLVAKEEGEEELTANRSITTVINSKTVSSSNTPVKTHFRTRPIQARVWTHNPPRHTVIERFMICEGSRGKSNGLQTEPFWDDISN